MTDVTGQAGKYLLVDTLGSGAFSKVKRGVHEDTKEEVAVKILKKKLLTEKNAVGHMRRELTIMKALNHPHVTKLITVMSSPKKIYIVMELAPNGDLYDVISSTNGDGLEDDLAKEYFRQLLLAVQHIHKKGVCHRDLKPENILIAQDGSIKVSDFGLSAIIKHAEDGSHDDLLYTVCGTPAYVAPEVIQNKVAGYQGKTADMWACGVILYTLVVGYLPFDGESLDKMLESVLYAPLEIPQKVSKGARSLLEALLERDYTKRLTATQALDHFWFKQKSKDNKEEVMKKMVSIASFFYLPEQKSNHSIGSDGSIEKVSTDYRSVNENKVKSTDDELIADHSSRAQLPDPAAAVKAVSADVAVPAHVIPDRPSLSANKDKFNKSPSANRDKPSPRPQDRDPSDFAKILSGAGGDEGSADRLKLERMVRVRKNEGATRMLSKRFPNPSMPNAPVEAPSFASPSMVIQKNSKIITKPSLVAAPLETRNSSAKGIVEREVSKLPAKFSAADLDLDSDSEDDMSATETKFEKVARYLKASIVLTDEIRTKQTTGKEVTPFKALITYWSKSFRKSGTHHAHAVAEALQRTRASLKVFQQDVFGDISSGSQKLILRDDCKQQLRSLVRLWLVVMDDKDPKMFIEDWMKKNNCLAFLQKIFSEWELSKQGKSMAKEVNTVDFEFMNLLKVPSSKGTTLFESPHLSPRKSPSKSGVAVLNTSFFIKDPVRSGQEGEKALIVDGYRNRTPAPFERQQPTGNVIPQGIKNYNEEKDRAEKEDKNGNQDDKDEDEFFSLSKRGKSSRVSVRLKDLLSKGLGTRGKSAKDAKIDDSRQSWSSSRTGSAGESRTASPHKKRASGQGQKL